MHAMQDCEVFMRRAGRRQRMFPIRMFRAAENGTLRPEQRAFQKTQWVEFTPSIKIEMEQVLLRPQAPSSKAH
jgi:hypothetical protein